MSKFSDQSSRQIGNRIQLPPSTDNKIPVVYGSAFMKPIIIDAKISTDNQTMWYVMAFSEAMDTDSIGTLSFGDMYWGDKKLNFDTTDQTRVVSWTDTNGEVDTKCDGLIFVYKYRDGSARPTNSSLTAWEVLQDSGIEPAQQWDTTKRMGKLCFTIIKLKYNQDAGLTGLGEITAVITNTLNKPGSVMRDYLTNTRYGAGLALARINTTSLTQLDSYSDELIYYTPFGGGSQVSSPRYRINGPVDTTKNFLDNLIDLCDGCDSWLSYNEKDNNWNVIPNRSVYDLDPSGSNIRIIDSSNIIGGINISPMDLNETFNSVEVQFPNTNLKDQPGYHLINIDSFPLVVRNANEPDNRISVALPYTNNIVQAQYIAARRLLQSREDLSITFTMDHSGIQVDAGDVIAVNHERYGWVNKFFRVNQVQENKTEEGSLYATLTASEYNDGVYDDNNIDLQDFTLDLNTGITDPSIVGTANQPTITNVQSATAVPGFDVNTVIPAVGTVVGVEFWYATTATINLNNYTLWTTILPISGSIYDAATTASVTVSGIDTGTYYWRARLIGVRNKSEFSAPSDAFVWAPNPVGTLVGQNFQSEFVPSIWNIQQNSSGTVVIGNAIPRLYGQSGGGLINYSGATTDNDVRFVNNSWRIGATTSTWVQGIQTSGITINLSTVTNQTTFAQFNIPTVINTGGGVMTVPVRYKNSVGEVYQGIPAQQRFAVIRDGTNGTNGFNGSNGTNGLDGFANFVFVPIGIEPAAANNAQKTAAWLAATGRNPVFNDNGTFYGPTTRQNLSYYGPTTQWVAATVFIDGDLVSTGTIRGAALVADAIYGKSFQSNNAFLGSNGSNGAWINGTNGNARFAGTVSIGNNLTVGNNASIGDNLTVGSDAQIGNNLTIGQNIVIGANASIGANLNVQGLINGGQLVNGIITTSTLASDTLSLITGGTGAFNPTVYAPANASVAPGGWNYSYPTGYVDYTYNINNNAWHKTLAYAKFKIPASNISSGRITLNVSWSFRITGTWTGVADQRFDARLFVNGNPNFTTSAPRAPNPGTYSIIPFNGSYTTFSNWEQFNGGPAALTYAVSTVDYSSYPPPDGRRSWSPRTRTISNNFLFANSGFNQYGGEFFNANGGVSAQNSGSCSNYLVVNNATISLTGLPNGTFGTNTLSQVYDTTNDNYVFLELVRSCYPTGFGGSNSDSGFNFSISNLSFTITAS